MKSTRDIKRKINSIKSTQKITKAMKMVAAAKLRRAQEAFNASKPYANNIKKIAMHLCSAIEDDLHPFLTSEKIGKTLVVLVASDRGLCGAFNSNVVKSFSNFSKEKYKKEIDVLTIGKSGFDSVKNRGFIVPYKLINFGGKITYSDAKSIGEFVRKGFIDNSYSEVYIIYNEFRNVAYQVPVIFKLLPMDISEGEEVFINYIYEPSPEQLLDELLKRYVDFTIYNKLLESTVGEHGSRMAAMENATKNAGEMIDRYVLYYNKARQAAITMELLDIVNCSEALNK
jgi:F-type H+-transporting ATPase subunit gamma